MAKVIRSAGPWSCLKLQRFWRLAIHFYYLRDMQKDPTDSFFYEEKLSRVTTAVADVDYLIDEILDTRGHGKNKEVLVSFVGYGDKFNSWIKESAVKDLAR